jgi:hypothetical protein
MVDYLFLISAQRDHSHTIHNQSVKLFSTDVYPHWYGRITFKKVWRHCGTLSLKTAGDWGMIQNCKLYNRVFVTIDKMAAMFAIFRGVKTVYLGIEVASTSVSVDE